MNQVTDFFHKLLDHSDWPARAQCGQWSSFHYWLYIASDLLIGSAFLIIPLLVIRYAVRQQHPPRFNILFFLFAVLIFASGCSYLLDGLAFWRPVYRLSALVLLITGVLSWIVIWRLARVLPSAVSLKTSNDVEREVALRLEVEQAFQTQSQLLADVQKTADIGGWEWDVQTGKLTWNDQQFRIWEAPPGSEMKYDDYLNTIHPADKEYMAGHNFTALQTGEYPTAYHRIITPSGEVRHILSRGDAQANGSGKVVHIKGTSEDVTRMKRDELQLFAKTLQLERKVGELEQFAYMAGQDLQEPLRKISSFSTMLQSSARRTPEEQQGLVQKVVSAAERMQQLIDDILYLSRVSNERLTFQPVNLNTIMRFVQSDMEPLIQSEGAQVMLKDLPEIEGVPPQLQQLFENLISNSIKFQKEDEQPVIRISAEKLTAGQLTAGEKVWMRQYNAELNTAAFEEIPVCRVVVADNGIGFEQKNAEKIFQIFQRLNGRGEYEGTGIGLAICRRIMENHHGLIRAESEPEKGATFHLVLPLSQKAFVAHA